MRFKDYVALVQKVLPGWPQQPVELKDDYALYVQVKNDMNRLHASTNDFDNADRFALRVTTEGQIHNYNKVNHSVWEED